MLTISAHLHVRLIIFFILGMTVSVDVDVGADVDKGVIRLTLRFGLSVLSDHHSEDTFHVQSVAFVTLYDVLM